MTPEQVSDAVDELAARGYAGCPVVVSIHNIGMAYFGTVAVNKAGLLVVDGGRVFVRCEQVSALEVASNFIDRAGPHPGPKPDRGRPINRG
jgi:hypothetical protein